MRRRAVRLGHWVEIEDQKIVNYQVVAPSTWNAGPRDAQSQRGPYEAALLETPIADPKRPLEVLRTVHSFDPCLACAVHVVQVNGQAHNKGAEEPLNEGQCTWRQPRLQPPLPLDRVTDPERIVPVYVWELPVRLAHWGLVISLVLLTVTGTYMHSPFLVSMVRGRG